MKLIKSNQLIKRSNGKLFDYMQLSIIIHHEHVQALCSFTTDNPVTFKIFNRHLHLTILYIFFFYHK